jgi:uncharacterized protein YkwD
LKRQSIHPTAPYTANHIQQKSSRTSYCLLVIAAVFVLPLSGAGIAIPQPPIDSQNASTETIGELLTVINAERSARRLRPVSSNERLQRAAQWMADDMARHQTLDMARHQTLDHTDSRHRDVAARLEAFCYNGARLMAENIAKGQKTPDAVVKGWLQSPPHRANLLHPEVQEVGIGRALDQDGGQYWVLDLGVRFIDR